MTSGTHRELRELLGAYALGGLSDEERSRMQAHLDGCPDCRAELAEIAPLSDDLRLVDVGAVAQSTAPPRELGERIRAQVAEERVLAQSRTARRQRRERIQRQTRRVLGVAAAAALVATALTGGVLIGRSSSPPPPPAAAPIPLEIVPVFAVAGVDVEGGTADLIAHTWGVEAKLVGTGFLEGRTYRAAFRSEDGGETAAGEFLGTGEDMLRCNLQAALLRDEASAFIIRDEDGRVVVSAELEEN